MPKILILIAVTIKMKKIICVELTHKLAPVSIREKAALNKNQTISILTNLKKHYEEIFAISTCNRLSFYAKGDDANPLIECFQQLGINDEYLQIMLETQRSVYNLLSTAAGLESQAIGEHQILGQIKSSRDLAVKAGSMGPVLNKLVNHSIHTGKKVRFATNIGKYSASLATVAFELIQKHGYQLPDCNVLIIGTGNMANLVSTILDRSKVNKLYVSSHDKERAQEMALKWNAQAVELSNVNEILPELHIIIGGSQGEINLLSEKSLKNSKCKRTEFALNAGSKKLLIDFGVPRNFNPALKLHPNILLYDLDDIKKLTYEGLLKRYEEIPQAQKMVQQKTAEFMQWLIERESAPLLDMLGELTQIVLQDEWNWMINKMGNLTPGQIKILQKYSYRIARKLNKFSITGFKKLSNTLPQHAGIYKEIKTILQQQIEKEKYAMKKIRIGTRGSRLALTQTKQVVEQLKQFYPQTHFEIKIIKTHGDEGNINQTGAFTKRLQDALLDGRIDIAVHSAKDLPVNHEHDDLVIAAFPLREEVEDVIITKNNLPFDQLPSGSVVGTGSLRRIVQLNILRPDLATSFIQGNIDTRIKKLESGEYDAIILAKAGLNRLYQNSVAAQILPIHRFLPAAGQGALALEVRKDRKDLIAMVLKINCPKTEICVKAERIFLSVLGGGCNFPIGVLASFENENIKIQGFYAEPSGKIYAKDTITGPKENYAILARNLAMALKNKIKNLKLSGIETLN